MKKLRCSSCQKEIDIRDAFHMDYENIANFDAVNLAIFSNVCLGCYRKGISTVSKNLN